MDHCDINNGTYQCEHAKNHNGLHETHYKTEGKLKQAVWKDTYSEVLTRYVR